MSILKWQHPSLERRSIAQKTPDHIKNHTRVGKTKTYPVFFAKKLFPGFDKIYLKCYCLKSVRFFLSVLASRSLRGLQITSAHHKEVMPWFIIIKMKKVMLSKPAKESKALSTRFGRGAVFRSKNFAEKSLLIKPW